MALNRLFSLTLLIIFPCTAGGTEYLNRYLQVIDEMTPEVSQQWLSRAEMSAAQCGATHSPSNLINCVQKVLKTACTSKTTGPSARCEEWALLGTSYLINRSDYLTPHDKRRIVRAERTEKRKLRHELISSKRREMNHRYLKESHCQASDNSCRAKEIHEHCLSQLNEPPYSYPLCTASIILFASLDSQAQ